MASKPVAKTMASTSYSAPPTREPLGVISSIGVLRDVDQRHVVAVEGLVVVGVDAEALGAERVAFGHSSSATPGP